MIVKTIVGVCKSVGWLSTFSCAELVLFDQCCCTRVGFFVEKSGVTVGVVSKSTVLVGGSLPMSFGVAVFFAED